MSLSRWHLILELVVLLAAGRAVRAQPNAPRIGYICPAGGRQGTTFQARIGGQYLNGVVSVYLSGGGVEAALVDYARPPAQKEITALRERLGELLKHPKDVDTEKEIVDIRTRLLLLNSSRNASPALAETATVQVTIDPGVQLGRRELRVVTPQGVSNPLAFYVGQLPEFCEQESIRVDTPLRGNQPRISQPATDVNIVLPATVNGRIKPRLPRPQTPAPAGPPFTPGDVDRYRFSAREGQHLVVAVRARGLIPYLPDAVPGWFQAVVALYDGNGVELAYDDDYRFHPDPVLHYTIRKDGQYAIEIRDAIYRGREDFVYRIDLGELPFVTSIFPLGGPAGRSTIVELGGWNLPDSRLTTDAMDKKPGIQPLSLRKGELVSNDVPFAVDTLPECLAQEPNDTPGSAQPLTLPVIVNGRIDRPGDWDVFRFEGRADDKIVAEVYARRLDSPLDSLLRLTDTAGRQLAFNDDHEDKGAGLNTHHADSLLMATLPADGTYYLHLGDSQQKGGAEYAYRLRVSPRRPDFDLRVTPSGINAGAGATVPITVYALRRDGFGGAITLALKDAPPGFVLSGAWVPENQDHVCLTLTVPPAPRDEPLPLSLEGRAVIGGREVVRPAVPADDLMQAFAYHHLVPAQDLRVAVTRRGAMRAQVKILGAQPVRIPAGATARIQVATPMGRSLDSIEVELSEPPEGVAVEKVSLAPKGLEIVLRGDAAKVKPGLKGNLIASVFGVRARTPDGKELPANRRRIPLGALPAIPFEVVPGEP
jgi:hypothetical protein